MNQPTTSLETGRPAGSCPAIPSAASFWLPRAVTIADIQDETPGVRTYRLVWSEATPPSAAADDGYAFAPGQFNMLYLPGWGESAISMSGPPPEAAAEAPPGWIHTIRQVGQVTGALARMTVGDRLALRGPFGKPWPLAQCRQGDVLLVAGGIGLAPLRPAIYALLARRAEYGELGLLYGARTPADLLYTSEWEAWQRQGLRVQATVDRASAGWQGQVGVVPLLLDRWPLPRPQQTHVLCCGPEVMMRFTAQAALRRGVPPGQIWVSLERHMQCAVGLCGHCQLGTELICRDGPVFAWDRVERLLQFHDL
jgi:NAD(P)H-flavin reductase